jgi:hypothetical protein
MRSRRSWSPCCAVVGDTMPNQFAEGATTGLLNAARILLRHRVARHPHRDGVQPALANTPTEQCAGTRVSGPGQPGRAPGVVEDREARRRREIGDVGDQRIEWRPILDGIELRHHVVAVGVY